MFSEKQVVEDISLLKRFWKERNTRFQEWYEFLTLVDLLKTTGMESVVSNEPQTFYNMAHYLLTKGELSHTTPIASETALELDRKAKINRACDYMWSKIDRNRKLQGSQAFVDELGFYLLTLGWYSMIRSFDAETGDLIVKLWSPMETYPRYSNGSFEGCVHSYSCDILEAKNKAEYSGWNYSPRNTVGSVWIDDYYTYEDGLLWNMILIDGKAVTPWVDRPEMSLLVSPVGGFPDKGSLVRSGKDWRRLVGRGIFEVNEPVSIAFNKWKTVVAQILKDTALPVTLEFSATPQATPEQLRERGGLFHYGQGENGLKRLEPAQVPPELQNQLLELRREMQKGSFNDAVYGMIEGQSGYSLSYLASSSANQILYPYMDAKHFVIGENDKFWLDSLKDRKKVYQVKGKFVESLKTEEIPDDISITVESRVATPKDWLERGTIAGMLKGHLDEASIITEIFGMNDPQAIQRRKAIDDMLQHPMSKMVELIAGYQVHADYLDQRGDTRQANLFRKAAASLESQLGVPPAGSANPVDASRVQSQVAAGTAPEKARSPSNVMPPEAQGFTPQEMRRSIGRGTLKAVR